MSVLVAGAIGVSVATGLILYGVGISRNSFDAESLASARAFADACAEYALLEIRNSVPYSGSGFLSFSNGECSFLVVSGVGQNRTVTASSSVRSFVRNVSVSVSKIVPSMEIASWQETP